MFGYDDKDSSSNELESEKHKNDGYLEEIDNSALIDIGNESRTLQFYAKNTMDDKNNTEDNNTEALERKMFNELVGHSRGVSSPAVKSIIRTMSASIVDNLPDFLPYKNDTRKVMCPKCFSQDVLMLQKKPVVKYRCSDCENIFDVVDFFMQEISSYQFFNLLKALLYALIYITSNISKFSKEDSKHLKVIRSVILFLINQSSLYYSRNWGIDKDKKIAMQDSQKKVEDSWPRRRKFKF